MSIYGVKIWNFVAGSIYEVNHGVRENYDMKPAMLTNSLFEDFMDKHGLKTWKGESTRDIICIVFNLYKLVHKNSSLYSLIIHFRRILFNTFQV